MRTLAISQSRFFSHLTALTLCLAGGALVVGCASADADASSATSEDDLRALMSAEIVGTLTPGETKSVSHDGTRVYRAFAMNLSAGQLVDLRVESQDGDPRAWLLGSAFQTLDRSGDVSATDRSARITRTVTKGGTYYLAFRDEKSRSATFSVSFANANASAPSQPAAQCTDDAQCGGGQAMCFFDRCVTVRDEGLRLDGIASGMEAAFDTTNTLRVAYAQSTYSRTSGVVSYAVHEGLWSTLQSTGAVGGTPRGATSETRVRYDRAVGLEPQLVFTSAGYPGAPAIFGDDQGPRPGSRDVVLNTAIGRNGQGTTFVAMALQSASGAGPRCRLVLAARPANGTFGSLEEIDLCRSSAGYRDLAVHVRKDGGADVLAAAESGDIVRYRRVNPIDPWTKSSLASVAPQGRPHFVHTHGADGTTHLVLQPYAYTTSSSLADYAATYVELDDVGVARSIALGTYPTLTQAPFPDLAVDGTGNVFVQKRAHVSYDPAYARGSVVRIDARGTAVERSLGLLATGSWTYASLAVATSGELAIVHVADGRNVSARRFVPIAR